MALIRVCKETQERVQWEMRNLGARSLLLGSSPRTSHLVTLWLFVVVSSCTSSSFLPLPLLLLPLLPSLATQALHHQATPNLMPIFAPVRLPNWGGDRTYFEVEWGFKQLYKAPLLRCYCKYIVGAPREKESEYMKGIFREC